MRLPRQADLRLGPPIMRMGQNEAYRGLRGSPLNRYKKADVKKEWKYYMYKMGYHMALIHKKASYFINYYVSVFPIPVILLISISFFGCAKTKYVTITDFKTERERIPISLEPALKCASPEVSWHLIGKYLDNGAFDRKGLKIRDMDFDCSRHRTLFQLHRNIDSMEDGRQYANYFLKRVKDNDPEWDQHPYTSKIAYHAALLCFFMLKDIGIEDNLLEAWDENVILLLRITYYIDKAQQYDKTADRKWTHIAEKIHYIVRHSYENLKALDMLVEARIYMRILAPKYKRKAFAKKSLCLLQEIKNTYPFWMPETIEAYIISTQDELRQR